jgi:hypothetical protein
MLEFGGEPQRKEWSSRIMEYFRVARRLTVLRISDAERFLSSMCNPLDRVHTPSDIVLISSGHRDRMRSNAGKFAADPF